MRSTPQPSRTSNPSLSCLPLHSMPAPAGRMGEWGRELGKSKGTSRDSGLFPLPPLPPSSTYPPPPSALPLPLARSLPPFVLPRPLPPSSLSLRCLPLPPPFLSTLTASLTKPTPSCALCRTFADLEEDVEVEGGEVRFSLRLGIAFYFRVGGRQGVSLHCAVMCGGAWVCKCRGREDARGLCLPPLAREPGWGRAERRATLMARNTGASMVRCGGGGPDPGDGALGDTARERCGPGAPECEVRGVGSAGAGKRAGGVVGLETGAPKYPSEDARLGRSRGCSELWMRTASY
ncbi:hypothetical protein B0H12DRAFT_359954 [Mycena haematopus]|nr:hypothetical protein B0H12DRAFT_359954 [Mycena haematopus]